jgi:hypothetical protein
MQFGASKETEITKIIICFCSVDEKTKQRQFSALLVGLLNKGHEVNHIIFLINSAQTRKLVISPMKLHQQRQVELWLRALARQKHTTPFFKAVNESLDRPENRKEALGRRAL